jgi:hypothetical protein
MERQMRPEDISDIQFVLKRYVPSSLIIVILSNLAESHSDYIRKILETNYILVLLLIGFAVTIMTNICRMDETVLESRSIDRTSMRTRIRFAIPAVSEFTLVFTADIMSVFILFDSLIYFAYGIKNPLTDFFIWLFHYPFSFGIMLAIGYFFRRMQRTAFGEIRINKDQLFCIKIKKIVIQNWITVSLISLILINLFLISI